MLLESENSLPKRERSLLAKRPCEGFLTKSFKFRKLAGFQSHFHFTTMFGEDFSGPPAGEIY
ncbi:hypothetical protein ASJ81_18490 [Methanosarcina spelaei]|uniref:Uncharacterized protein n=1 Tax=Methanosarcina spelaei TaxID=1036679 RepID=A0A2A2HVI2_9EURY|nr:hypothetical protein ASJ81_18490 [Methanosarcina spelaei]